MTEKINGWRRNGREKKTQWKDQNEMGESIKIVFKALNRNDSGNEITGNSSKWNTLREKSSALHFAACHLTTPISSFFPTQSIPFTFTSLTNEIMCYKYLFHMKCQCHVQCGIGSVFSYFDFYLNHLLVLVLDVILFFLLSANDFDVDSLCAMRTNETMWIVDRFSYIGLFY